MDRMWRRLGVVALGLALLLGPTLVNAAGNVVALLVDEPETELKASGDAGGGGGINLGTTKPEIAGGAFGEIGKIVSNGFNIVIAVAAVVFVVLILIGGVMYLTSFGNDEQTKKAKTLLLDAVVGLVIVVTAWAVGTYVLKLLGLTVTV